MASIHPRINKDGSTTFRVMFRIDGRQAQESFMDPVSAERFKQLVERAGGRAAREILLEESDVGTPTLVEWMEEYLDPESGLLTGIAKDTRATYARVAERSFLKRLGDLPLDAITEAGVSAWINWQVEQPTVKYPDRTVSAKTVKNYHALLSAALHAAVKAGHLSRNVAHGIPLPRGKRPPIAFLTEVEFARVYAAIPEFYQPLALLLAGSGLRFSEASALTWGDVIEADGGWCLDVNKAWKDGANANRWVDAPKSDAGVRIVSVADDVVEKLGARRGRTELLFTSRLGNPISSTTFSEYGLQKGVKASGIEKAPRVHDLRHSHASWLIARNVPLPYIQRRLGHESIQTTTKVYGHLMPEALNATRDAARAALSFTLAS